MKNRIMVLGLSYGEVEKSTSTTRQFNQSENVYKAMARGLFYVER